MTTIALCIPHTPWIPERVDSMNRLLDSLHMGRKREQCTVGHDVMGAGRQCPHEVERHGIADFYRELTDKAPNQVWSVEMWKWMLETGADFCLTLQDDVEVSEVFWPALRAMIPHVPRGHILGLSGVHPVAPDMARRGHRWYRTTSWVIGWAYGMWREDLEEFLKWRLSDEGEALTHAIAPNGEDTVLGTWATRTKRDAWHPVPAICDHDVSIGSSYNNDHHGHRRPCVTWHRYEPDDLVRPDYWRVNGKEPLHFTIVPPYTCWWCGKRAPIRASQQTGASICALCLHETLGSCLSAYEQGGGR